MVTLKSMSDEQLIKLFTDGNNRAFDTLLLRYKSFLYSHVYSITKDYDESNDILQEAYIRMINSLKQKFYIENGRFKFWALRIAHNIAIDTIRESKNGDIKCSCSEEFSSIVPTDYYDNNIEDEMVEKQIKKQVHSNELVLGSAFSCFPIGTIFSTCDNHTKWRSRNSAKYFFTS